jgi:NAD(P)-dependent dehydrogenase (short-subunit alcohol dehydrogenase family)
LAISCIWSEFSWCALVSFCIEGYARKPLEEVLEIKILVTGSTSGIGLAVSQQLLQRGLEVVGVARSRVPNAFPNNDSRATFISVDLSRREAVLQLCKAPELQEVQGLVHCAGVANVSRMGEIDASELERMFFLNAISPIILINKFLPKMIQKGFGRIVLIGSIVGDFGGIGLAGYSSTKSALSALNLSVNREIQILKRDLPQCDVTVNLVKPGYCDSNMTRNMNPKSKARIEESSAIKRFIKCEEVAREIVRLVGHESNYISGAEIPINGGQTL